MARDWLLRSMTPALCAVMLLVLAACGQQPAGNAAGEEESASPTGAEGASGQRYPDVVDAEL